MTIKPINKDITINAPAATVWRHLTNDASVRQWYNEFAEGSHAETDWQVGSPVRFVDGTNCGMFGHVVAADPGKLLSVELDGFIMNGKEDVESEGAKAVKGGRETYTLTEEDGKTHLAISTAMGEDWYDTMVQAWDRALLKLKDMAEPKG